MKPRLFDIAQHDLLALAWFALITSAVLLPASLGAQERKLQVVSSASRADLYLGLPDNPKSFSAGTARASGNVTLKPNDAQSSAFTLTLYPANRTPDDPAGIKTNAGLEPAISFQSQHARALKDGGLEVSGQLTVTTVSRNIVVNISESYSGPEYGPPQVLRTSHEATFIFAPSTMQPGQAESARTPLLETSQVAAGLVLTAVATLNGERFPELSTSITNSVWPDLVNDDECNALTSVGEDFSGAVCSATVADSIAPATQMTQAGEDYAGVRFVPPTGSQVTIQLHLELADVGGVASDVTAPSVNRPSSVDGATHCGHLR